MTRYLKVHIREVNQISRTEFVPESEISSSGNVTLETPSGDIDGDNDTFEFSAAPKAVFYQGVLQDLDVDYTLAGSTVTFAVAPVSGTVKGLV